MSLSGRVLRRVFGPKKAEIIGGCRELRNDELHNFYSSPDVIRTIKLRTRWIGYVAYIEREEE
jgi:hypothetical protein